MEGDAPCFDKGISGMSAGSDTTIVFYTRICAPSLRLAAVSNRRGQLPDWCQTSSEPVRTFGESRLLVNLLCSTVYYGSMPVRTCCPCG